MPSLKPPISNLPLLPLSNCSLTFTMPSPGLLEAEKQNVWNTTNTAGRLRLVLVNLNPYFPEV